MTNQPLQSALPFGWIKEGDETSSCVPVVDFDFESVYQRLDGEETEDVRPPRKAILSEILSPGELSHAFKYAKAILDRSSSYSIATRLSWLKPDVRARRIAGLRRAARDPVVRRRHSVSSLRAWRSRDRQRMRDSCLKLWRERRDEMLAKHRLAMDDPDYRRRISTASRAAWANPHVRQKILAKLRSPEARQRAALKTRQYFERHPEARTKTAQTVSRLWLNPEYRAKRARTIVAKKVGSIRHPIACSTAYRA